MNYFAYDLLIASEIPLPLPTTSSNRQADIQIALAEVAAPENLSQTYDGVWYAHGENSLYLRWDTVGAFSVRHGNSIVIEPLAPAAETSLVTLPLLGTVMAVALHQRGMADLHGSSVLIKDKAIIFLGEKGQGKSTLAEFLRKRGHHLISDDICAVNLADPNNLLISPSFPKIKLWPDAMAYLDYQPEHHQRVHPQVTKRNISVSSGFANTTAKIAAIIVLKTSTAVALEPLSGHQTIPALLPHMIINRFAENQPFELVSRVHANLVRLTKNTKTYTLNRPSDITLLPQIADLLIEKL